MATLQGMKNAAYKAGHSDAIHGRVYMHSFTEYYRGLGVWQEYQWGWNRGRKENLDKRAEDRAILRAKQQQARLNNTRTNNVCL